MVDRGGTRPRAALTAYWDTGAIVPLCCFQPQTKRAHHAARHYGRLVTWWATGVEAVSSFNRLHREGLLTVAGRQQALTRLTYLRRRWHEVLPSDEVRDEAERLLGVHPLRAAEALQLSAALAWCARKARGRHFIVADGDLATAAEAEGFTVVRVL